MWSLSVTKAQAVSSCTQAWTLAEKEIMNLSNDQWLSSQLLAGLLQNVSFIIHMSKAALLRRMPASIRVRRDSCRDTRDALYYLCISPHPADRQ